LCFIAIYGQAEPSPVKLGQHLKKLIIKVLPTYLPTYPIFSIILGETQIFLFWPYTNNIWIFLFMD
jgi:hypothetical protein